MNETVTRHRITVMINRVLSKKMIEHLKETGIPDLYVAGARSHVIRESKRVLGIGIKEKLVDTPLDIISFIVPPELADPILNQVILWGEFTTFGRGSVYCEEITIPAAHDIFNAPSKILVEPERPAKPLQSLQKICCIVQRGKGTDIARVALYSGAGVPVIYFGNGTGVRDKMGILRFTIPAEKEIVVLETTPHNSQSVMELMIDIGQLSQPGKGFIFTCTLKQGVADLQVRHGGRRHAATMEQIIGAIDQLRGDTAWRRLAEERTRDPQKSRNFLTGLVELSLFINAGKGQELVRSAMEAGVTGATISTGRHISPPDALLARIGHSRETVNMIIPASILPQVIDSLAEAGAFSGNCFGQAQVRKIQKAFTYIPHDR